MFKGDNSAGTTTDVHVLHNGLALFDDDVIGFGTSSARSFATTLTVDTGDTIDFAVGYGNGNYFSDTTGLKASIAFHDAPALVTVGGRFRYNAAAVDPDGDKLVFDLPVKPSGMSLDPNSGAVIWVPNRDQIGLANVILRVQD